MARDLHYTIISISDASAIDFSQVMENSWDSSRWNTNQTEVMVHWVGETPSSIKTILEESGETTHSQTEINDYIRKDPTGKSEWDVRPAPPTQPS